MAAKKIGAIAAVLLVAAWLYRKRDEVMPMPALTSASAVPERYDLTFFVSSCRIVHKRLEMRAFII